MAADDKAARFPGRPEGLIRGDPIRESPPPPRNPPVRRRSEDILRDENSCSITGARKRGSSVLYRRFSPRCKKKQTTALYSTDVAATPMFIRRSAPVVAGPPWDSWVFLPAPFRCRGST